MRLINADALRKRMYHDAFETDSDMQKWDSGCWIRFKMFENAIEDMPTIEERKRGEWSEAERKKSEVFYCSVCGGRAYHPWIGSRKSYEKNVCRYRFCPNCGADMRGDK